ncbi:MAG: hypothetical protein Kow0042_16780 [Calditrichia bacterium]
MKISTVYQGKDQPFEGDRLIMLQSIPVGAQIQSAKITLTPVHADATKPFVEVIDFTAGGNTWGATRVVNSTGLASWLEIDFHARRTLRTILGKFTIPPTILYNLQVDMGGAFVGIAEDGTFISPGGTPFKVGISAVEESKLPGLTVSKFRLSGATNRIPDVQRVTVFTHPTNVSLKLGNSAPFWTRLGEMIGAETTPDFSRDLQDFLSQAQTRNGVYLVPLTLHSDLIARLDVHIEIEYNRKVELLPEGIPEVQLPFDFASLPKQEEGLLKVSLPPGARVIPGLTTARVQGAFQESRVAFGPTGVVSGSALVPLKPDTSQAQLIEVDEETPTTSIDVLLAAISRHVSLDINILPDSDGKPFNDPLLDQPVRINIDRDTAGSLTWISSKLHREFLFKPGDRYWLVVHTLEGEAIWGADPAAEGQTPLQFTDTGGLSWRQTTVPEVSGALAAYFRLRYVPPKYQVPIELKVGSGESARRVSLDRFQPLGRVDFTLDFEDVARAINDYLQETQKVSCLEAEHVLNGDLEDWLWLHKNILPRRTIELQPSSLGDRALVTAAPFGTTVYTALRIPGQSDGIFKIVDYACGQQAEVVFDLEQPSAMAITPDGDLAYIIATDQFPSDQKLIVIDIEKQAVLATVNLFNDLTEIITALAISPDGARLYFGENAGGAGGGIIRVVDNDALRKQLGKPDISIEEFTLVQISLDWLGDPSAPISQNPVGFAISPDGNRLFIISENFSWERAEFHVMDTVNNVLELPGGEPPFVIPGNPRVITLNPAGTYAAILSQLSKLPEIHRVDTRTFEVQTTPTTTFGAGDIGHDIVFSTDGERIIAAIQHIASPPISVASRIDFLNTQTLEITESLSFEEEIIRALDMARPASLLFAISSNSDNDYLRTVSVGLQDPIEWESTGGMATPIKLPAPLSQAALFGSPPLFMEAAAARSQVVPVQAGCTYSFEFLALACKPGATAELFWIGDECSSLTESITIPLAEIGAEKPLIVNSTRRNPLVLHQTNVQAPSGAIQAEIRFTVPAENVALVDQISLKVTTEKITNNKLVTPAGNLPQGWKLLSEELGEIELSDVPEFKLVPTAVGLLLENLGSERVALTHSVSVSPEEDFVLELIGKASLRSAAEKNPYVEIIWQDAAGESSGAPLQLEIAADGSPRHVLEGRIPAQTGQAEIRLWVPPQSSLEVEQLSLRAFKGIEVPLNFIAQAPGELTISDFRVAYEVIPASPPPVPEKGLCPATPPGLKPGEAPKDCCCCPCCGSESTLKTTEHVQTPSGRSALLSVCPQCGCSLISYRGKTRPGIRTVSLKGDLTRLIKSESLIRQRERIFARKRIGLGVPEKITAPPTLPVTKPEVKEKVSKISPGKTAPLRLLSEREKRADLALAILTFLKDPDMEALKNYKLSTILKSSPQELYRRLKQR